MIVAVLLIAGLAVGAYLIGDEDRQEQAGQEQEQQQSQPANIPPAEGSARTDSGNNSQSSTPGGQPQNSGQPSPSELVNTGPETLASTGSENTYLLATAAILVLILAYRSSNKQLHQAQLGL